jgi:hypothetical protein
MYAAAPHGKAGEPLFRLIWVGRRLHAVRPVAESCGYRLVCGCWRQKKRQWACYTDVSRLCLVWGV